LPIEKHHRRHVLQAFEGAATSDRVSVSQGDRITQVERLSERVDQHPVVRRLERDEQHVDTWNVLAQNGLGNPRLGLRRSIVGRREYDQAHPPAERRRSNHFAIGGREGETTNSAWPTI